MRRISLIAAALLAAAVFASASVAVAATAATGASKAASGTANSIPTYNLDWTLPTAGRSGCVVCHEDKGLVHIVNGQTVSLWVDTEVLKQSAHKSVGCTECHTDFAYKTPHETIVKSGEAWRAVAKSSCKNCHNPSFNDYTDGAHSQASQPGDTSSTVGAPNSSAPGKPRPLCGDCHMGHAIPSKTDTAAMEVIHASALEMCGKCHEKATETYADYYHGAAYQRGAKDAPACWQCHAPHKVLVSTDRNSWTNPDNLVTTCGQCHKGTLNTAYLSYSKLVHRKAIVLSENPVFAVANSARQAISNAFYQVAQVFGRNRS
jgi:cytochrome c553